MTTLVKQTLINRCLKDFVYFYNYYLSPNEIDEFLKHLQEGSEQMYIRHKVGEILARLNDIPFSDELDIIVKFKPKNGANFDLKKIIKDNEKDLKL